MNAATKTKWRITGEEVGSCNCAWGCPCQFNALPTTGSCEALLAWEIRKGEFDGTKLDGVRYAWIVHWPGPIHQGNGTRQLIVDSKATPAQRDAIVSLTSGKHGGAYFEIFASVLSKNFDPVSAPIEVASDRDRRIALIRIPGLAETRIEPIKNPVTGQEQRARIELPNGFEYKLAEMANSVQWHVSAGGPLKFEHKNTYAQLYSFEWSNA